jgi:hypothetical protein
MVEWGGGSGYVASWESWADSHFPLFASVGGGADLQTLVTSEVQ